MEFSSNLFSQATKFIIIRDNYKREKKRIHSIIINSCCSVNKALLLTQHEYVKTPR